MAADSPASVLYDENGQPITVGVRDHVPSYIGDPRGYVQAALDGSGVARIVASDSAGRLMAVGPAAAGSAPTGAPVLLGGSDGSAVRVLVVDVAGRQVIVGPAAAGAVPTGSPVRVAGSDGSVVRDLRTDSGGRLHAVGPAPVGTGLVGDPVVMALRSATGTVQIPEIWTAHPTGAAAGLAVRNIGARYPSFYAFFDRIAPAANKYMATLFNASSTRKVVVQRVFRLHTRESGAGGVNLDQYLARITARTAGTSVTIRAEDTADTLSSGISADTGSTSVTEDHIVKRLFAHAKAVDLSNTAPLNLAALDIGAQTIWTRAEGMRGITLRTNQGITIRNVTSSTAGNVSYIFEFTDEAA